MNKISKNLKGKMLTCTCATHLTRLTLTPILVDPVFILKFDILFIAVFFFFKL